MFTFLTKNLWRSTPLLLAVGLTGASAQTTISLWNFNSNPADANTATGTLLPAVGSGTASLIGGTTGSFSSGDANGGSSDPATGTPTDDSGWQTTGYTGLNGANKSAGILFNVPTTGLFNIQISYDVRHSNTSSRYERLQYSLNGTDFVDALGFSGAAGDTWFNGRTVNLTGIAGVDNNPNFAFRIVSEWESTATGGGLDAFVPSNASSSYAGSGTWRFDMVTVSSVPEPSALALLGVGGLALAVWRRGWRRN